MGRAGESLMKAGMGLLIGIQPNESSSSPIDKKALTFILEAIEAHVPDPINRFHSHRKYGISLYTSDTNTPDSIQAMRQLAYQNIVTSAFAHETVAKTVCTFVNFREYSSALYATGAVSALLQHENTATISLSRAFLNETILQLAMNDIVAAETTFMEVHLQINSYLSARECKLAEDLIRAMKTMDYDALENAKLENRHALANLDQTLRNLVMNMQISGISRSRNHPKKDEVYTSSSMSTTTTRKSSSHSAALLHPDHGADSHNPTSSKNNFNEMMNIMDEMGLGDNDDDVSVEERNQIGIPPEVTKEFDDDEIDLR